MMTIKKQANQAYVEAKAYCTTTDIRLSRDPVEGYWLHFDGHMRFVQYLNDVRGVVDWINLDLFENQSAKADLTVGSVAKQESNHTVTSVPVLDRGNKLGGRFVRCKSVPLPPKTTSDRL
jgi:hypothetical protein